MMPITQTVVQGKKVLELGCGSASLMTHILAWDPALIVGVDLGDAVISAKRNLEQTYSTVVWRVEQADLTEFQSDGFDFTYCIGVLQHLTNPKAGLDAVIRNTLSGGVFHVWVYAREGNGIVIYFVDPIRKVASLLPWWVTKYGLATPLVAPFYVYAKILALLPKTGFLTKLPLYEYSLWIAKREFAFFRHVAFDQLVTPQTVYFSKATIENWLKSYPDIDQRSTYILMRNGNSWKFGGRKKT
jgi:ubiquinone/menaquinone biosynthesis C-methylase UbiE